MIKDTIFHIVFYSILIVIGVQDFKHRKVYWFLFPLALLCCFFIQWNLFSVTMVFENFWINILIVSIMLSSVLLYFQIKGVKIIDFFKNKLGIGDVVLFPIPALIFSPVNYVLYLTLGMFLTLILSMVLNNKNKSIPLAGYLSIILVVIHVSNKLFFHQNLMIDLFVSYE